jgi:PAS domain S-box-containing protein
MSVIAITFQAMVNYLSRVPQWICITVSLLVVNLVNSVVFWTLSSNSLSEVLEFLPDDLIADVPTSLLMAPLVVFYLMRIAPQLPDYEGVDNRPTFDLLLGSWGSSRQQHIDPAEVMELTRRYRHLTDNIDAIFYVSNPEEPIAFYVSPAFETITGYTRKAYFSDPVMYTEMVLEEDRHLLYDAYSVRQQGYDTVYRIRRPDGEIRWLHDRTFPLLDDDGNMYRIVGIVHDVTDRHRALEQQDMLSEHTHTINLMREFISEATHDIKNPLTGINLNIQLLEQSKDKERRQKYMENIQSQFLYISQLVDGISALARLDSGGMSMREPVDMYEILAEVTGLVEPKLRRKQHELQVELQDGTPVVMGSHEDLRRAVVNLVDNATEYSPPGATIRIAVSETDHQLRIVISDSGIGIAPEDLPHIFDRYYRVRGAQHLKRDGTGLGLAIVKRIIEQHQGSITVESKPGEGSTFTITLPTQPGPIT